jgi:hypothetical protein
MRLAHVNKNKVAAYLEMDHFSSMAQQPLVGQCLLIIETSLSHWDTPHSVGLWTSDQLDAETSTWHYTHKRQIRAPHPFSGIRTRNPNMRAAADTRLRSRGH